MEALGPNEATWEMENQMRAMYPSLFFDWGKSNRYGGLVFVYGGLVFSYGGLLFSYGGLVFSYGGLVYAIW